MTTSIALSPFVETLGIQDLYPLASGLSGDYHSLDWLPGDDAQVLIAEPRHDVEGIVLDAEGRPVVGAPVGAHGRHRGPWTLTDDKGQFRLVSGILDLRRIESARFKRRRETMHLCGTIQAASEQDQPQPE